MLLRVLCCPTISNLRVLHASHLPGRVLRGGRPRVESRAVMTGIRNDPCGRFGDAASVVASIIRLPHRGLRETNFADAFGGGAQRLSRQELIELLLRHQRSDKTLRLSCESPSTDRT